ncbi:MAG TPA: sulfite dehydrogenase, partial [Alphaproteobacteria bacterium]|nr:sulfite dehydrogenase [Alphaproteobacteria bacterium]
MTTTRRQFLAGAVVAAGSAAASGRALAEGSPENLPPNVAEWSQYLGASVDEAPYGMPSEYEADVVRRSVEWLTASRESSINFTPLYALDGTITPSGVA